MKNLPDATYRVSVKAVIRNEAGQLLLLKEHDDYWTLPGGGIDHGESMQAALARELHEELAVDKLISCQPIGVHSYYSERSNMWRMWLLCDVRIHSFDVGVAKDGVEARYLDIAELALATHPTERRIYELRNVLTK